MCVEPQHPLPPWPPPWKDWVYNLNISINLVGLFLKWKDGGCDGERTCRVPQWMSNRVQTGTQIPGLQSPSVFQWSSPAGAGLTFSGPVAGGEGRRHEWELIMEPSETSAPGNCPSEHPGKGYPRTGQQDSWPKSKQGVWSSSHCPRSHQTIAPQSTALL